MPIYEYECEHCGKVFEKYKRFYENSNNEICKCGHKAHKIISNSTFVLKGGGWYASGYSSQPKS